MGTMSMLNQAAVEALCAAKYLENYLDCMDNLPDDLQRNVSQLRELDCQTCEHMKEIALYKENYQAEADPHQKKRALNMIQRALVKVQEIGDEKLQIVAQIVDFIENRSRQLEQDLENLDPSSTLTNRREEEIAIVQKIVPAPPKTTARAANSGGSTPHHQPEEKTEPVRQGAKRQRRQRTHQDSVSRDDEKKDDKEKPKKKKKRKVKKEREGEKSPHLEPIDPDEPTYCLCDQVSYGEMIGCDNEECHIEWFHFNCVGLSHKPKGKWFCPNCRGDRPNVRRQDK